MTFWKNNSLPELPFYAVIFVSEKSENLEGYPEMDNLTMKLASEQDGFLGYESVNNLNKGIFISYWQSVEAIDNWRKNKTHQRAKFKGIGQWYNYYHSLITKVESHYQFAK